MICRRDINKPYKHNVVPKIKGGSKEEIVKYCKTCCKQVHMIFSENELAKMTLDDVLKTEAMLNYINWFANLKARMES